MELREEREKEEPRGELFHSRKGTSAEASEDTVNGCINRGPVVDAALVVGEGHSL